MELQNLGQEYHCKGAALRREINVANFQITYFCNTRTKAITAAFPNFNFEPLYSLEGKNIIDKWLVSKTSLNSKYDNRVKSIEAMTFHTNFLLLL